MATAKPPLVIDLDGTLTPTDTLVESVIRLLKQSPAKIFMLFFLLLKAVRRLKGLFAATIEFSVEIYL